MEMVPRETRPGVVAAICLAALAATWLSYFAVYDVLPERTWTAHWGLFLLALGSTGGLLITFERVLPPLFGQLAAKDRPIA